MYANNKTASKKQNLEHTCSLQESCKTLRRWQIPILLVKGGHCVGDCGDILATVGWLINVSG